MTRNGASALVHGGSLKRVPITTSFCRIFSIKALPMRKDGPEPTFVTSGLRADSPASSDLPRELSGEERHLAIRIAQHLSANDIEALHSFRGEQVLCAPWGYCLPAADIMTRSAWRGAWVGRWVWKSTPSVRQLAGGFRSSPALITDSRLAVGSGVFLLAR
jgi:hypothetical protein